MNTQDAMRKVTSGELCEFPLRDGRIVKLLDKPYNGRVKVVITDNESTSSRDNAQELLLRELRAMFDTVGFAAQLPAYNPLENMISGDVYDLLRNRYNRAGVVELHVIEDMLSSVGVSAVSARCRYAGLDVTGFCWRVKDIKTRLNRLARVQNVETFGEYDLSRIMNEVGLYTIPAGVLRFDVIDKIDWYSGDFGDSGSCYWGSRSNAKEMLTDNGGMAIRFFHGEYDKGIGRAWIMPVDGGIVVFNAYGEIMKDEDASMRNVGAIISMLASESGIVTSLENNGTACETLWINNGTCCHIGHGEASDGFDLEIEDYGEEDSCTCIFCGDHMHEDDANYTDFDGPMCNDCYSEHYFYCSSCESDCSTDERHELRYRARYEGYSSVHEVCSDCFSRHGGVECCNCGEEYSSEYDDGVVDSDGDNWCERCASVNLRHCDGCEEYCQHTEIMFDHGNLQVVLCESCIEEYSVCESCGNVSTSEQCYDCQVPGEQLAFSTAMVLPSYVMVR